MVSISLLSKNYLFALGMPVFNTPGDVSHFGPPVGFKALIGLVKSQILDIWDDYYLQELRFAPEDVREQLRTL